jgi:hypothetical protein
MHANERPFAGGAWLKTLLFEGIQNLNSCMKHIIERSDFTGSGRYSSDDVMLTSPMY